MATIPPVLSETFKRTAALRRSLELGAASLMRRRPEPRLAIEGLPEQFATLQSPGLHAVYVDSSAARDALLFNTARLSPAKFTTLALARAPDAIAASLRERGFGARHGDINWPRKFNVLALDPPAMADEFEANTVAPLVRLVGGLRALKRFGLKVGALYVIEGADHWFSWHNSAALAQESRFLANWCAMRQCSMVLILNAVEKPEDQVDAIVDQFNGVSTHTSALHGMHGFHGAFSGVSHLLQSHGEMIWRIEFWRVRDALVTGESLPLRFTESGELALAQGTVDGSSDAMFLTRDESRVVVSHAAVAAEPWLPPHWEVVPDNTDVVAACRDARGVTVLLDYSNQRSLPDLCQTIHALRGNCGRALKLVIRERGEFMRHQYELLALSLGANLVIGRDVPFSRVQSLLESVQGQLNTRPIISDYQSALSAALSDSVCGYLPVPLFCEQVQRVIERGHVLRLPHMLFQLQLRPEIAHLEVLQSCVLRRAGDICTADHEYVYLFLFACRVSDADNVLQRIFGANLARYFEREVRYIDEIDFVEQLRRLKTNDLARAAADYSDALATERTATPVQEPAAATAAPVALVPAPTVQVAPVQPLTVAEAPTAERAAVTQLDPAPNLKPRREKWPRAEPYKMPIVKSARP